MKRWQQLAIWLVVLYLLMCFPVASFLAQVTLHPNRQPFPVDAEQSIKQDAEKLQCDLKDVEIVAADRAVLRGWFIQPSHGNGNAVIVFHGVGDNRLGMVGYAELLMRNGYNVLMPDARAHGLSGGNVATYGLLEADDIRRWFEWIETNNRPRCIYGLGESMGAALLLQALPSEPNFCAVIAESPFSTFREIAYDRMGQQFHAGPWVGRTVLRPIVEIALLDVRWKYDLNLDSVSPEDAISKTRVPVMLIHGQADSNIPVRHSRVMKALNPGLVLWEVPNADHCGAISTAPDEFPKRVLNWFASHPGAPQEPVKSNRSPSAADVKAH